VTATRQEIGVRVDALARAHQGDDFVTANERLAEELGPDERPLLQEVLLERAAGEESFQRALRRRFRAKGWTRRSLARLEGLWRDDRADAVAAAIMAGSAGETTLGQGLESLREDAGRAGSCSTSFRAIADERVRAWVSGAGADILGDGGTRLIASLSRDRDAEVRDGAVTALLGLGPEAIQVVLPDLRRRLHAKEPAERVAAMEKLAAAGTTACWRCSRNGRRPRLSRRSGTPLEQRRSPSDRGAAEGASPRE
jgi:hypothetical protein